MVRPSDHLLPCTAQGEVGEGEGNGEQEGGKGGRGGGREGKRKGKVLRLWYDPPITSYPCTAQGGGERRGGGEGMGA